MQAAGLAWLAPLLHNDGHRSVADAGNLVTIMLVIQTAAMPGIPALLGEKLDWRIGLAVTTLMLAAGFFGFAFSPASTTWAWIILVGIGHGGLFPLVLALPATMSRDGGHAGRLSGMAFFVGYGCAAVAPLLVGWLRDDLGDFDLAFALLGAAAAVVVIPIMMLSSQHSETSLTP